MAIFNGLPGGYTNPYYAQPYYQQQPQTNAAQNSGGIIWVTGEAGAKAYLVAPNSTVQLWDSEAQVIYLKSADASGMPSMKVLDYTIREASAAAKEPAYATKQEIDKLREQIDSLHEELEIMAIRRKKKEADDE